MSEVKQWVIDAASRVAGHSDGSWCSTSWQFMAEVLDTLGDDYDAKLDLVAVMFDEIESLHQRLAAAEAAARWLYGICTGKLVWCDIKNDSHPAVRWPWLEDEAARAVGGRE